MVLYPNKLPESERVCFGICTSKTPKRLLSNASAFKVKRPCVLPKT